MRAPIKRFPTSYIDRRVNPTMVKRRDMCIVVVAGED